MTQHDGIRKETRTRFIEGEGYLVEEVEAGAKIAPGQSVLASPPKEPGQPVIVTLADVPLSLAKQVCTANGLLVVPESFLNEEQLAELKIDPDTIKSEDKQLQSAPPAPLTGKPQTVKMTEAQAIKAAQAAKTFEELNDITRNHTGAKVLRAAEKRAEELKK